MGFFGVAYRLGSQKDPSPWNLSHISYNDETWYSYTLPKEDQKNIWITWHTSWVLLTSVFFTENQQILQYQEIKMQISFWYIISNSFDLSWVFNHWLNKNGCDFDNVSKNTYTGLLEIKLF